MRWIVLEELAIRSTVNIWTFFKEINHDGSSNVLEDCPHELFSNCCTQNFLVTRELVFLHSKACLLDSGTVTNPSLIH